MVIKKYDMHKQKSQNYSLLNQKQGSDLLQLTVFLIWFFNYVRRDGVSNFIKKNKEGIEFEEVNIDIDNINNLVYLSESWYDYKNKPTTKKIDELLEEENFIELCKIGFLDHITMTKDNFTHILLTWDKLLDQQSPFALLYQDDKDWFDVKPFETQEAMEQFVADYTKK